MFCDLFVFLFICLCFFLQCEARMSAVPLYHSAHASPGPGSARQRHSEGAAVALALLLRRQAAAASGQAPPPLHHGVCGRLSLSG